MDTGSPVPAALCRVGPRVTASQLAMLTAFAASAPHLSGDAVVSAVPERLGDGSAHTVYSLLRTFTDVGLVHRIEPAGRPGPYELRIGDNYHHSVCRCCDAIADVDSAVGDTLCLTADDDSGYEIDAAQVMYPGRCPECVAATSVSSREFKRSRSVRHHLGHTTLDPEQPRSRAMSHLKRATREEDRRV